MPYLSIKEASDLTGKNEKTIRRLIKKPESTSYIKIEEGKLFIDAEYLDKMYNSVHLVSTHPGQSTTTSSSSTEALTTHTRHVHAHPSNQDMHITTHIGQGISSKEVNKKFTAKEEDPLQKEYYLNLIAAKDYTIQTISEQLQVKDQQLQERNHQLQTKDQHISQLIERTREQNIIIQSLQDKFTKQLQPSQSAQDKKGSTAPMLDKVLIGVAVLASLSLLTFLVMILWAYLSK